MHRDAKAGPYVVIAVSDTGTGIPSETLDRIFEPFFTTKEVGKGTGLGLSTVISIVKGHGGFVTVDSEMGKGATFNAYFPAIEAAEIRKAAEEKAWIPAGNGELILVVDDEASLCEITRMTLEGYGYRVITAKDGAEAMALYAQNREEVKVVLMDMMMPVMEGLTGLQALHKINPQIKIVASSGLPPDEVLDEAVGTSVQAFLRKPYTGEKLLRTLHEILSTQ